MCKSGLFLILITINLVFYISLQVKLLRDTLRSALGEAGARLVDVNTIDGYQGREKDVIIFSTVRTVRKTGAKQSIGFVADERRINVGLTRARCSLIVVGCAKALRGDPVWGRLVNQARNRSSMFKVAKPYKDFFKQVTEGKVRVKRLKKSCLR